MIKSTTITDLNAAYARDVLEFTREAEHLRISPELLLSYMIMLANIYEKNKERINGKKV